MTASASRRLIPIFSVFVYVSLLLTGMGEAQTLFTDVTGQVGLDAFLGRDARNVVFVDYDNDGFQDVFITENRSSARRIGLFHNTGDGRLEDQTFRVPTDLHIRTGSSGSIFGDYDNDGDEDLFLPVWPHNVLLRNDRGLFTEVDAGRDLADSLWTENALWLDYDRDGYLDLYVSSNSSSEAYAPRANRLMRNNGDGTFTDQTAVAGLDVLVNPVWGGSLGAMAAGDFNDDGWPDLFLGVFSHANRLFLSDGEGGFQDATSGDIGDVGEAFTVAVGDIDNDGDLDIFQGSGNAELTSRSQMLLNLGGGEFLDVTEALGLGLELLGINVDGAVFADIDNDGDLDLVISRATKESGDENLLLLNDGTGMFVDQTAASGIEDVGAYTAVGDYDEDGFVDLLYSSFTRELTALFRNNGNANHWLRVELMGIESNRNGIGSRLLATSGDLEQIREILGGVGRQEDERVAHFGLGDRTQVDLLEVRWPSGQVDVLTDIPADQKIRVIEGQQTYHVAQPTVWKSPLPDSLVAGSTVDIGATVLPALFEQEAQINRITADLSELGGPEAVSLTDIGDGLYHLESVTVVESPRGWRTISVMVDQTTSLGPYWTRLSRSFTVLPSEDLILFGDALLEGWKLTSQRKVELDPEAMAKTYQGSRALGVQTNGDWGVSCKPPEPLDLLGYDTLQFAIHPGDARGTKLLFLVGAFKVDLLSKDPKDIRVDLEDHSWKVVEIPVASMGLDDALSGIFFSGRLEGTFYLDDIRLVAAKPGDDTNTVVLEQHSPTLPRSFSLAQNYPNPFNSATVIRFALPTAANVDLAIFNLAGQQVATLVDGMREAGTYTVNWDGRDDDSRGLASGVYLYRLRTGDGQGETRKLVLIR